MKPGSVRSCSHHGGLRIIVVYSTKYGKVYMAQVRTLTSTYKRLITRLALILPAEFEKD